MKKKNAAGCFGRGAFYKYLAAMRIQRVKKKKDVLRGEGFKVCQWCRCYGAGSKS